MYVRAKGDLAQELLGSDGQSANLSMRPACLHLSFHQSLPLKLGHKFFSVAAS